MKWPTKKEQHEYMKQRQDQNIERSRDNPNENWMLEKLQLTGLNWTRQAQLGYRLFDFWSHECGIAVEVDGPEHDVDYDSARDEYNFCRSGILILRVRNKNEVDANAALLIINSAETWNERRQRLGLKLIASHHTKPPNAC